MKTEWDAEKVDAVIAFFENNSHIVPINVAEAICNAVKQLNAAKTVIAELSSPNLFWDGEDAEVTLEHWSEALEYNIDFDEYSSVLCARELPKKWVAHFCESVDSDGTPEDVTPKLFDNEADAARCWPDSLEDAQRAMREEQAV